MMSPLNDSSATNAARHRVEYILILLVPVCALVIFLCYSHWWARLTNPGNVGADWLGTFYRWPWLRLPILWSICNGLYVHLVARQGTEFQAWVVAQFVFFPCIAFLTHPGLESLHLTSDPSAATYIGAVSVVHSAAAWLCVRILRKKEGM